MQEFYNKKYNPQNSFFEKSKKLFGDALKQPEAVQNPVNNTENNPAPVQPAVAEQPTAKEVYPGNPKTAPATQGIYTGRNNAVSDIMKYKRWYDDAEAAGDTAAMENAHNRAVYGYDWLRNNGYGADADSLEGMNYAAAKKWATNGMTQTRPYFYDAGKAYGLSKEDIDNLLTYDNLTRDISFGGTNLGSADITIDGVSYWENPAVLEKAFKDYLTRTNTTMSDADMSRKHTASIDDKINELWGMSRDNDSRYYDSHAKYMDTLYGGVSNDADYKTITEKMMKPWNLASFEGRDAAAAEGMARNGGNIDSFAAADARQRQAALMAQGQQLAHQAGMDAYSTKMNNIYNGLESLGVYIDNSERRKSDFINQQQNESQRLFENSENQAQRLFENEWTAKKNAVDIEGYKADITGNNPLSWALKNDATIGRYFNEDGSLNKDAVYNADFTTMIAKAQENGASDQVINALKYMRGLKGTTYVDDFGEAIKDGNVSFTYDPGRTAAAYLEELGIESNERMLTKEMEHDLNVMDKSHEQEKEMMNMQRNWDIEDRDYAESRTGSSGGSSGSGGSKGSSGGGTKKSSGSNLSLSDNMKTFIKDLNNYSIGIGNGEIIDSKGNLTTTDVGKQEGAVNRLIENEKLTDAEKTSFLNQWNISPGTVDTVRSEAHWKAVRQN